MPNPFRRNQQPVDPAQNPVNLPWAPQPGSYFDDDYPSQNTGYLDQQPAAKPESSPSPLSRRDRAADAAGRALDWAGEVAESARGLADKYPNAVGAAGRIAAGAATEAGFLKNHSDGSYSVRPVRGAIAAGAAIVHPTGTGRRLLRGGRKAAQREIPGAVSGVTAAAADALSRRRQRRSDAQDLGPTTYQPTQAADLFAPDQRSRDSDWW